MSKLAKKLIARYLFLRNAPVLTIEQLQELDTLEMIFG